MKYSLDQGNARQAEWDPFRGVGTSLARWCRDQRAHRAAVCELSGLSDRQLADIGLSRTDIEYVVSQQEHAREAGLAPDRPTSRVGVAHDSRVAAA